MTDQETGPPKCEGPAPATGTGTRHSLHADAPDDTAHRASKPGTALELYQQRLPEWIPCTPPPVPQDINSQLDRRRRAAERCVPLDCGYRDPWLHDHTTTELSEKWIDAGREAALHLLEHGLTPVVETRVLRHLWRRGGEDRRLAQHLHQLEGQPS